MWLLLTLALFLVMFFELSEALQNPLSLLNFFELSSKGDRKSEAHLPNPLHEGELSFQLFVNLMILFLNFKQT